MYESKKNLEIININSKEPPMVKLKNQYDTRKFHDFLDTYF